MADTCTGEEEEQKLAEMNSGLEADGEHRAEPSRAVVFAAFFLFQMVSATVSRSHPPSALDGSLTLDASRGRQEQRWAT